MLVPLSPVINDATVEQLAVTSLAWDVCRPEQSHVVAVVCHFWVLVVLSQSYLDQKAPPKSLALP